MSAANVGAADAAPYRERLSPSLWVLVSAALCGPMAALVFAPLDTTVALIAGAVVAALVVALLVAGSPLLEIRDGVLHAGRARIDVRLLGEATSFTGEDARHARGAGLDPRAWHVLRGGIEEVAVISVTDADAPTPYWIVSTRTPDRFAAVLRRAQLRQRTPRR